jgi:steroid 5-alpha reductase family enzyme
VTEVLVVNAVVLAGLFFGLWLVSLAVRDASIVDIFWGMSFVVVAWVTALVADGAEARRVLLVVLVSVWGLRLSGYLAWRNLGKGEDYRYQAMRERYVPRFWLISLFVVFGLQAALSWVVSLPVQGGQVPADPDSLVLLDYVGIVVWATGLAFESIGDWQLARFKADPANQGEVMDRGLWRYTRHPNYFGDFLVWWGLYLVALATVDAWWTIVGPLVMSVLLIRVSGAALLERSLRKRRPGYEGYVRRTSSFFPRRPRRD